jgi:hypothetical protein
MSDKEFVVSGEELRKLQEDASVSGAIKELAGLLSGRTNDLPHRFRAPHILNEYFKNHIGNQSYYQQIQLDYVNSVNPLMMQLTTRPNQHILEMVFQDATGQRLFTLEIEYGE